MDITGLQQDNDAKHTSSLWRSASLNVTENVWSVLKKAKSMPENPFKVYLISKTKQKTKFVSDKQ